MQYTLRNIPENLDAALRELARTEKKSLNQVAIDTLVHALCHGHHVLRRRDLSDLAGRWEEDPEFDRAIAEQDRVDDALWR